MITTLLFDFSRVILLPTDKNYAGSLNKLHAKLSTEPGYNFSEHFYLNEPLLQYLETIKSKYNLFVFTTGVIQNVPLVRQRIDKIFKKIFTVAEIALSKTGTASYLYIAEQIGISPQNILFIDDSPSNLVAAKQADLNVLQFLSPNQVITDLKKVIKIT